MIYHSIFYHFFYFDHSMFYQKGPPSTPNDIPDIYIYISEQTLSSPYFSIESEYTLDSLIFSCPSASKNSIF